MPSLAGPELLRIWRESQEPTVSLVQLGSAVDDKNGDQIGKFERGERKCLPFKLCARLSRYTGIPFDHFLIEEQRETARDVFNVMARDAAA